MLPGAFNLQSQICNLKSLSRPQWRQHVGFVFVVRGDRGVDGAGSAADRIGCAGAEAGQLAEAVAVGCALLQGARGQPAGVAVKCRQSAQQNSRERRLIVASRNSSGTAY